MAASGLAELAAPISLPSAMLSAIRYPSDGRARDAVLDRNAAVRGDSGVDFGSNL